MSEPIICEMILLLGGEKEEKAQNRKVEKSKRNGSVLRKYSSINNGHIIVAKN